MNSIDDDNPTVVHLSGASATGSTPVWADEQETDALPPNTRLNEFLIEKVLGHGGFGIVYQAYDTSLDCPVAIKEFMPQGMALRAGTRQVTVRSRRDAETFKAGLSGFVNEARMLARFDSPSLVKVKRFWEENGTAYMVMPLYRGPTLKQVLQERRVAPDEPWLLAVLANVLDAMEIIHREHTLHRDIAPDNILILDNGGRPLLLDFGAARRVIGEATQQITAQLKPGFAPIEQYGDSRTARQGPWTDVYALGAVAYFVVAGTAPQPSVVRNVTGTDEMVPAREVGRGRYSERLLGVIDRALVLRPDMRIQDVAQFRNELGLQYGVGHTMPPMGSNGPWPPEQSRRTRVPPAEPDDTRTTGPVLPPPPAVNWPAILLASLAGVAIVGGGMLAYGLRAPEGSGNPGPRVTAPQPEPSPSETVAAAPQPSPSPPVPAAPPAAVGNAPLPSPTSPALAPAPPPTVGGAAPLAPSSPPVSAPSSTVAPAPPAATRLPPPGQAPGLPSEEESWREARRSHTTAAYEEYLNRHPRGPHAEEARMILEVRKYGLPKPPAPNEQTSTRGGSPARTGGPSDKPDQVAAVRPPAPSASASPGQAPPPPVPAPAPAPGPVAKAEPGPLAKAEPSAAPRPLPDPRPPGETGARPPVAAPADVPSAPSGSRTITFDGQTWVGQFTPDPVSGVMSGTGQVLFADGGRYVGRMVKGQKDGPGEFTWASGQRYKGEWSADVLHGQGTMRFANGDTYTGQWVKGRQQGKGEFVWANNGPRYAGEWVADEAHGQGTMRFPSGDVYTGSWVKGRHHGKGRYTYANGNYWEGEFREGRKTDGRLHSADGQTLQMVEQPAPAPVGDPSAQRTSETAPAAK